MRGESREASPTGPTGTTLHRAPTMGRAATGPMVDVLVFENCVALEKSQSRSPGTTWAVRPSELRCVVELPRFRDADGRLRAPLRLPRAYGPRVPGHTRPPATCWSPSLPRSHLEPTKPAMSRDSIEGGYCQPAGCVVPCAMGATCRWVHCDHGRNLDRTAACGQRSLRAFGKSHGRDPDHRTETQIVR